MHHTTNAIVLAAATTTMATKQLLALGMDSEAARLLPALGGTIGVPSWRAQVFVKPVMSAHQSNSIQCQIGPLRH